MTDTTLRTNTTNDPKRGIRSIWPVLASVAVAIVLGALAIAIIHHPGNPHPHNIYEYTVPPGTVEAIEAGEQIYVFPRSLDVRVGDQLIIHNNDTRVVEVGPYTIDRNATLAQTFTQPGTIIGICTIHPSGRVTINIRP